MDFVTGFEKLGVPIAGLLILAFVFWKVIPPMVDSFIKARADSQQLMAGVIERNTAAMQALKDITERSCDQMAAHDAKVNGIGEKIDRIDQTTQRIERIVSTGKQAS